MKNAVLTGIVAGAMGYATLAAARETTPIVQSVEFQLQTVVAQANQVAAQVAEMQAQLAALEATREAFARRLRMVSSTRPGAASGEAARLDYIVSRLTEQIEDLRIAIAEMQQTLVQLTDTIRRLNSSGVPAHPLGEPTI